MTPVSLDNLPRDIKDILSAAIRPEDIRSVRALGRTWRTAVETVWIQKLRAFTVREWLLPYYEEEDAVATYGTSPYLRAIPPIIKWKALTAKRIIEADFSLYAREPERPFYFDQATLANVAEDYKKHKLNYLLPSSPEFCKMEFCRIDMWYRGMENWGQENWTHNGGPLFRPRLALFYPKHSIKEAIETGVMRVRGQIRRPDGFQVRVFFDLHPCPKSIEDTKKNLNKPSVVEKGYCGSLTDFDVLAFRTYKLA